MHRRHDRRESASAQLWKTGTLATSGIGRKYCVGGRVGRFTLRAAPRLATHMRWRAARRGCVYNKPNVPSTVARPPALLEEVHFDQKSHAPSYADTLSYAPPAPSKHRPIPYTNGPYRARAWPQNWRRRPRPRGASGVMMQGAVEAAALRSPTAWSSRSYQERSGSRTKL